MSISKKPVGSSALQRHHHSAPTLSEGPFASAAVTLALMLLLAAYFVFPLIWLLIATTKTTSELFSTPMLGLPRELHFFANLKDLSTGQNGIFWRWYVNSVVYSMTIAVFSTLISALAGYALSKYEFRFSSLAFSLVLVALLVPGAALTIPVFLLIKATGLINSYAAVILPSLASPFGVYFMRVYVGESMPGELIDSGRIDGAGDFQIFGRIALPIIRPGLVTLFLIAFVGSWNNFFLPLLVLNDPKLFPLTLGIDIWTSTLSAPSTGVPPYPMIMMGSFLSILPMVILFPLLRRHIAAGMITGGIKM